MAYPGYGPHMAPAHCARCNNPGPDVWDANIGAWVHSGCAGDPNDVLAWPWLILAYVPTILGGCTLIGALIASLPYYVWKTKYPNRARAYNRHVWIAFAIGVTLWMLLAIWQFLDPGPRAHP